MMSENEGEGFILELNGSIGIKAMLAWPGRTCSNANTSIKLQNETLSFVLAPRRTVCRKIDVNCESAVHSRL
jgi:hypothetical protein